MTPGSPPRRNIVSLAAVQVLRFSASLVVSLLLARGLGLTTFGQYATLTTAAHLLGFLANLGIHQVLPRSIARADPRSHAGWVRSALIATGAGAALATLLLTAWAAARNPDWAVPAFVAGLSLIGLSLVNVYMAAFEGVRQMRLQLPGVALGRTVLVAGTVGVLAAGGGLATVFGVQVLAWCVTLVVFALTARGVLASGAPAVAPRALVRRALPFAGFVLFAAIQERVDILVIDAFHSDDAVGLYRAATVFLVSIPVLARIVATAAYPSLARSFSEGESIHPALAQVIRLSLATGLGFAVGGSLFGPELLTTLLGSSYSPAGPLVVLGAWMLPLMFVRIALDLGLIASDRERVRTVAMVTVALVNLGLNLLVVPRYGATGALITTLVCEAVLVAWFARGVGEVHALRLPQALLVALPAAFVLGGVGWVLPGLWIPAVLASVAWLGAASVTGAVRRADLATLARW